MNEFQTMIEDYLGLVQEVEDNPEETVLFTGFINEVSSMNDFTLPLEAMLVVLKSQKPAIASYLELIGSRDFKKLLRSQMTEQEALQQLGVAVNYFIR